MKITLSHEQHQQALSSVRCGLSGREFDQEAHVSSARFAFSMVSGYDNLEGFFVKTVRGRNADMLLREYSVLSDVVYVYDASPDELNHWFRGFIRGDELHPFLEDWAGRYVIPVSGLRPMSELLLRRAA